MLRRSTLVVALVGACTSTEGGSPGVPPPAPEQAPAASETPPAKAPVPEGPESAPEPPPVEPDDQPEPPAAGFHIAVDTAETDVNEGAAGMRLFETTDGSLFVTAGPQVMRVADDGAVERKRTWMGGITPIAGPELESIHHMYYAWNAKFLGGRWPDALFLATDHISGFRGPGDPIVVHRWRGERWQPVDTMGKDLSWWVVGAAPWLDDKVLGLRAYAPGYAFYYDEDETAEVPKAMVRRGDAAVDKAKRLVVLRGKGQAPKALATEKITRFDAIGSGEIVAKIAGAGMLHYDPATEAVKPHALPTFEGELHGVDLVDATHAWAWGGTNESPYLAAFDGAAWTSQPTPEVSKAIIAFDISPGGTQWATAGMAPDDYFSDEKPLLWSKPKGKPWQKVELPPDAKVYDVIARADDDVWLAGDRVYRSQRPKSPITIPTIDTMWKDAIAYGDPITLPTECPHPVVLLKTEADGDYAAEKAALDAEMPKVPKDTGLTLAEVDFREKTHLVLLIDFDSDGRWIDRKMRAALGDQIGDVMCVLLDPKREVASYRGPG
ncbi:MAG: hypothetical protein AAF721_34270 [Myxococcota bacterium]